ncbi:hypothetical protein M378DRAFT_96152 [Amanita muscaria Koide BX008]|uniref:Sm domain-containing protein n=1 Tax=Amanita muscaria (strain Koide BX008) TaxID=946122 RepID=A0A0C2X9R3_AMAMK|nr:hypothetical protein M378DRAFT_96152 [Amanita muscaria Koide BX008]
MQPSSTHSPAVRALTSLLRQTLRVTTNDSRIYLGMFAGTDQPLNLLLVNAEEYRVTQSRVISGRFVGQVLIPWHVITKVETPSQSTDQVLYI